MQSDKVRDTCIEGLLMKMGDRNFVERQLQRRVNKKSIIYDKLSRNDRILFRFDGRKNSKVDGYYKLLLPLEDEDI